MKKVFTIALIHRPPMILLGMKKIAWGKGRWNGFGGKVEDGETIEECAIRELEEESGIKALKIEEVGAINFKFINKPKEAIEVRIFNVVDFKGEAKETEEMRPQWFETDKIPYEEMWEADRHWLPIFLKGQKFKADFTYDDADKLISKKIEAL